MSVRVAVLSLFFVWATLSKPVAHSVPWCAPEVALLTFKDQNGQEAAKVELRSVELMCSNHGAEKAAGVSLERSMRSGMGPILFNNQAQLTRNYFSANFSEAWKGLGK